MFLTDFNADNTSDNPASDILGANLYRSPRGTAWTSILVRSGVFADEPPPSPDHKPKTTVGDVWDAVEWALAQEGQSMPGDE